jgi:hypothetical protein
VSKDLGRAGGETYPIASTELGPLELTFEAASLRADPDLTLLFATAEPDSTTHAALTQLATPG